MAKKVDALEMARSRVKTFSDLIPTSTEDVISVPLNALHEFKDHPFKVLMDEAMDDLVESIRENGVLVPILVRKAKKGGYEIIAGHRRTAAARLAELAEIPAICKDYDDATATIAMVHSNKQREEILISERAFAFKMEMDAVKRLGKLRGGKSRDIVAEESGVDSRTVSKYVQLTELIDDLLLLADEKKLKFVSAYELSFLPKDAQEIVYSVICATGKHPDAVQAAEIRNTPVDNKFTGRVTAILSGEALKKRSFKLSPKRIDEIFPLDMTQDEIDKTLSQILDAYAAGRLQMVSDDGCHTLTFNQC